MICIHHNDLDGRCGAAIVNKFYLEAEDEHLISFMEMDYKDTLDLTAVLKDEIVVIVDFSLKPEVMADLLEITPNVIWIDHHKTAAEYDYGRELMGIRDFTEPGKSGAMLAWDHFFAGEKYPLAVTLTSDYDTWQHKHAPDDMQFKEAMEMMKQNPAGPCWHDLLGIGGDLLCVEITSRGKACMQYRDGYCAALSKSYGFETQFAGLDCYALNVYKFGSQTFGRRMQRYDAYIAFIFDGERFTVSMYSDKAGIDVSAVCKEHGGGGHTQAAGFNCETLPFHPVTKGK